MSKRKRWKQHTEAGVGGRVGRDVALHSFIYLINIHSGPTLLGSGIQRFKNG